MRKELSESDRRMLCYAKRQCYSDIGVNQMKFIAFKRFVHNYQNRGYYVEDFSRTIIQLEGIINLESPEIR